MRLRRHSRRQSQVILTSSELLRSNPVQTGARVWMMMRKLVEPQMNVGVAERLLTPRRDKDDERGSSRENISSRGGRKESTRDDKEGGHTKSTPEAQRSNWQ